MTNHRDPSCDEHDREIAALREVAEHTATELAVLKKVIEMLQHALFGNGNPGIISKLDGRVRTLERWSWVAIGIIAAMQFLSGSGTVSLKGLLGK